MAQFVLQPRLPQCDPALAFIVQPEKREDAMRLSQVLSRVAVALAATMAAWTADAGTVVSQKFQSLTLKRDWVYNVYLPVRHASRV
jgi:hypothetical protein